MPFHDHAPLSVLDLAPISEGSNPAAALANTIDLAQHAEQWGYRRYWVAEHHFVAVAGSNPAVLIGHIAGATTTIRVGSAAVQVGQTTAVSVVESFGLLDAFHPGRIDLGLGRSGQRRAEAVTATPKASTPAPPLPSIPGPSRVVDGVVLPEPFDVSALLANSRLARSFEVLTQPGAQTPDFAEQVADIAALLEGTYRSPSGFELHAVPGEGADVELWIFGSSKGQSAQVAGARGLPFVANYHVSPGTTLEAVQAYRAAFRPSAVLAEPYVVVSADVVVADDDDTARHLASTYGHWVYSIRSGHGAVEYPDPATAPPLADEQRALVADRLETQFVGSPDTVVERLAALGKLTDADELVITSVTHDHGDRLRSHELLAKKWGLI
ncbi:LLM class flavin-dependent oxidoreductase [Gordonia polyisoprenivorans]|uniref:LLM class flavin-dependent oxidoreductase n=1 Tax=Gordonia polyisoprenivorans TaxID=84595 RepID=UPI001AD763A2|nr:LLM class flavin-dependent oxidoreductase [Gordonia polyisoprenivorans]QTI68407.1 LLM class flavin-dependent oxidoreductase [Gordonia polyisoprenivorans]